MEYILTVDIGTTAVKTIAYSLTGEIIGKIVSPCQLMHPTSLCAIQNPESIFQSVISAIKNFVTTYNMPLGVCFSAAMHGLMAVDHEGKPLTDFITWADNRSFFQSNEINSLTEAGAIYSATGTPIHPMSPLTKIKWLKETEAELCAKVWKFVSIKEYIFYKLFNRWIIDFSVASATGIFNIHKFKWDENALKLLNISEEILSEPVPVSYSLTEIQPEYKKLLGLEAAVPFIVGASDGCLANLGSEAVDPGTAALTLGTSGAIRITSPLPILPENRSLFSYILSENQFVCGGAINNGGILINWFSDLFNLKKDKEGIFEDFEEMLNSVPPGADGLICLPYLLGERAPVYNPLSSGVFVGLKINHRKEHILRSIVEGIVFNLYSIGQNLQQNSIPLKKIHAGGGVIQSETITKIIADVFKVPVAISPFHDHSCRGAFIVATQVLNMELKSEQESYKVIHPNKENIGIYEKIYPVFSGLYNKHKEDFNILKNFQ